ncbi:signal recognition particle protein [Pseudoprevotella muciniphila]|uniref:Signal recognition particle protein n=1 Tax=Pseudoprevotella muciniphila TaxID=2133944 RepID=A0A5P8E562_9BACT|nr:signal recognition particle protein [Pseudoprevotella muciniphila]QFQ12056.1 signal recognition particle protein [Pseudoprevotella muciniphila]
MFESLSERLERSFKILKGEGKITEVNVADALKDVRKALIAADVNYKVAKTFIDSVKQKAMGMNVLTAVRPKEMMIKVVHDELAILMGGEAQPINLQGRPAIILMSGLQGSGKTTMSGKLAYMLKKDKKQHKPLLVACDVYRPAAIDQLKVLGDQLEVPVYSEEGNKNPVEIALNAVQHAKAKGNDIVIVDTAGRLAVDEEMMDEIENLKKSLNPSETLFVVDAMTGQDAVNTAKEFNERIDFDGVVLTKLDGDTRGGAALSIRTVVDKPIKFVGIGEKMDALNVFHPQRMADRILGMGDVVSLVERAQQAIDEKEAEELERKLRKNKFDFEDFLNQIQTIKKMGNIKDLVSMIPGVGKAVKDVDIDDNAFKSVEAIIRSMTPKERKEPSLLANQSRKIRIAKGSGTTIQEVNRLIKQFDDMRKMMKQMNAMDKKGMMGKMKAMRQMQQMQQNGPKI